MRAMGKDAWNRESLGSGEARGGGDERTQVV